MVTKRKNNMNAYDFDKTIYDGDCTVDFYFYCLKHYPRIYAEIPRVLWFGLLFKLGIVEKKRFKSIFFKFATLIPDLGGAVESFWAINKNKIKDFYIKNQQESDFIISASPTFILETICNILGIKNLIATEVDLATGNIIGENCYGAEKVKRFFARGEDANSIDEFYSDSYSDSPLAEISKKAYLVKGNKILPW